MSKKKDPVKLPAEHLLDMAEVMMGDTCDRLKAIKRDLDAGEVQGWGHAARVRVTQLLDDLTNNVAKLKDQRGGRAPTDEVTEVTEVPPAPSSW